VRNADNLLDHPSNPDRPSSENSDMRESRRSRRTSQRFRPRVDLTGGGAIELDRRLMLSADSAKAAHAAHHASHVQSKSHIAKGHSASSRVTPAQEINNQYAQFQAAFQTVIESYVQTLNEQSTGTVTVSATLTAPYLAGSVSMQVDDPAVFGPEGVFASPITATAMVGNVPVGQFVLTGSSTTQVAVNPALSSSISLSTGTVLTAQVPTSASSSAASIFPGYITSSTQQLAVKLVSYFNSLPFKLPRMFAFPHQPQRTGAIQQYVFQVAAGTSPTSLKNSLLSVTLPQTAGGDLQIYNAAIDTAITASRLQMLDGVQQIFAHKLQVVPISTSASSTTTTGTGTTSTTGTSGSTSTGTG
jgi:hypothetical protein